MRILMTALPLGLAHGPGHTQSAHAERRVARISLSIQVMAVYHAGRRVFEWPVFTAHDGKITPIRQGHGAQGLSRNHHRSSRQNTAP